VHRTIRPLLVVAVSLAALSCAASGQDNRTYQTSAGPLRLTTVARGLEHPWGMAFLPDGRILVTERPGRMRIVERDGQVSTSLEGVPEVHAQGQGGLLDVALDPAFQENRRIYFSYAEPGSSGAGTAVARARLGDGRLENVSVIFRQRPKVDGSHHFGSRLVFGRDGNLFVTMGDRNKKDPAQDLGSHIGKVVRINLDGSVPKDNPFVSKSGALPEIWSYGHRNIQGATRHPETGALWTAEHGAQGGDEVNNPQPGRNYGWPVITYGVDYGGGQIGQGTKRPGMEQPVHYWDPSIAPSGMTFYTGDRYAGWRGDLFIGSLKFGLLSRLEMNGSQVVREERLFEAFDPRIRDVVQGPDGLLYLLTDASNGEVIRVEPVARASR
jgi:glucose/arabinose dehydrogenase